MSVRRVSGERSDADNGELVRGSLSSSGTMQKELMAAVEKYDIHPVIGDTFAWEDAPKAFESMMKQSTIGKLVISI